MPESNSVKRDLVAQWAFDTRPLLSRFHLWLEDVEVEWERGDPQESFAFVPQHIRRCVTMTSGVTALGTQLFAQFGGGAKADKRALNQVKKEADAMSAYVMSESLWHFTRKLPENHAIMVCLGEGLMPKAGETPEMGANPLLGFGRVYARPEVAQFIDSRIRRLLNDPDYGWDKFYDKMLERGITIWGAAIDTLENTSRFAKGNETGPMTILHIYDQPLVVSQPYEAYMGSLSIPRIVKEAAERHSIHIDLHCPRTRLVDAIELAFPGIERKHIHVWTLRGDGRTKRLGALWDEWRSLGADLIDSGWTCPSGLEAFADSGTYAPTYLVGNWKDEAGATHVFLCDGYAASAEAMQAASLSEVLDIDVSLALCSPSFALSSKKEFEIMRLRPNDPTFPDQVTALLDGDKPGEDPVAHYRRAINEVASSNLPVGRRVMRADDFFPEKHWRVLAASGYMCPDPYSGAPGVTKISDGTYQVTCRLATKLASVKTTMTFRFLEKTFKQRQLVFSPLLERFAHGEDYHNRAVKVSDSGRIRNEIQTLFPQALEYDGDTIRVHFDRINAEVILPEKQLAIRKALEWYKLHHPVWFRWLSIETGELR